MQNTAQGLMISLVADALGFSRAEPSSDDLTPELIINTVKLAKKHDLAHLVCHALLRSGRVESADIEKAMNRELILAHLRYERSEAELNSLCAALEQEGLPHIPLKGAYLRRYYPEPWMRSSCDLDILVKKSDLEAAERCLVSRLGYERGEAGPHDISFNSPGGVHVELHFSTVEEGRAVNASEILGAIWESAQPEREGGLTFVLSDPMFYFYHLAHMAKHFENGGCGVRPFADLIVLEALPQKDKEGRRELLVKGGLARFDAECLTLARAWFLSGTGSEVTQLLSHFVLTGGAYGNVDNMAVINSARKGGRVKYILSRIFMPYIRLKALYPVIERHKWLTPFCQVHRWLKMLFSGRGAKALDELKSSTGADSGSIDSAKELLHILEL